MYFSDRIALRSIVPTINDAGFQTVGSTSDTEVWANYKSASRSEYYTAAAAGRKVDAVFEVHLDDYSNETQVIFGSKTYRIERAYQQGLGIVSLSCALVEA